MRRAPLRASAALCVTLFLIAGIVQTLFALVAFQRADDHAYFFELAQEGVAAVADTDIEAVDLKAKAVATVFHALATPTRWLGAGEIGHLIWLRLLTLAGFLFAFEWTLRTLRPKQSAECAATARNRFMALCLLYPGQLAWTASLLRDGPACALLFAALLAWSYRNRFVALVCLAASLALRPEYALIVVVLWTCVNFAYRLKNTRHRLLLLAGVCALLSAILFEPRHAASEFAQVAFAEASSAFPAIGNPLDVAGYGATLAQALIDPLSLSAPSPSLFFLAEAAFFIWLVVRNLKRLASADVRVAGLLAGIFISLWLFAYFEVFVSGFSRHRMALVVLLIAVTALMPSRRQPRHAIVRASDLPPPQPAASAQSLG